jgi:hypothetical protein
MASRVPPRVGELAQFAQALVQLLEPVLPDVVRLLGEHSGDLSVRHLGDALHSRSQADQAGATVGGIGNPLDVLGLLELFNQRRRALLGDPRLLSEVGDPRTVRGYPRRDPRLRQRDVGGLGGMVRIELRPRRWGGTTRQQTAVT